jgi:hypothetical protein
MKHDDFDPDAEGCLYVGSASDEVSAPRRGTLRNLVLKAIALAPELSGPVRFEIETYGRRLDYEQILQLAVDPRFLEGKTASTEAVSELSYLVI